MAGPHGGHPLDPGPRRPSWRRRRSSAAQSRTATTRLLWIGVAGYTALVVSTYLVFYFRVYHARIVGEGIVHDLRNDIFAKLQTLTMGFFNKTKVGRVFSRMISDAEAVRGGVQDAVFMSIVNLCNILVASAIMLGYDAKLFLIVVAMLPFYYITYHYFRQRLSDARRAAQESMSRVTANLAESVVGIRITQGFVRQNLNARLFGDLVADHALYNIDASRAAGQFTPTLDFLGQITIALIFIIGGYRVLNPSIAASYATLMLFYFQATNMLAPVAALGNQYNTATIAMAGAERGVRPARPRAGLRGRDRGGRTCRRCGAGRVPQHQLRLRPGQAGAQGDQLHRRAGADRRPRRPHRQRQDLHHQSDRQVLPADRWRRVHRWNRGPEDHDPLAPPPHGDRAAK